MRNFKELTVWQKAHQLVIAIYKITKNFPSDEKFGLISQVRRSTSSIPANIAEGCGRKGDKDFARFLSIASGSASETEYHLILANELGYIDNVSFKELDLKVNEVKKMLNSFMSKLE